MVLAIAVGPEWHSVVDETTGEMLDRLVLTEQCDGCGGSGRMMRAGVGIYRCETCEMAYPVRTQPDEVCVWQ